MGLNKMTIIYHKCKTQFISQAVPAPSLHQDVLDCKLKQK